MSEMSPFSQITGTARIFIAPVGTAPPAIDTAPTSPWVPLGHTTGDQSIEFEGALEYFHVNEETPPFKVVRAEEMVRITFTLVDLTPTNYAYILHNISNVVTEGGTATMPYHRGRVPSEYALLLHGSTESPFGLWPAFNYIPRCVSASEPEVTRSADGRAELECEFVALWHADSPAGRRIGWSVARTVAP